MSSDIVEDFASQEPSIPEKVDDSRALSMSPMDSIEYEEYFSRKAHESIDRVAAFIAEEIPHVAPGKTWLTLDPDQQRTVKSNCVNVLRSHPKLVDIDLEDERNLDDMMCMRFGVQMLKYTYPEGLFKTKLKTKKTGNTNTLLRTAIRRSTNANRAIMFNSGSDRLETAED